MTALLLLSGVPLIAVAAAVGLLLPGGQRLLPVVAWLPLGGLALLALPNGAAEIPWLLLGTRLGVDPLSAPLILLAVVVWTLAGWHARRSLAMEEQPRFFCFWLLTWCGNLCVFITLDAASFFAAYAFMTLGAYGLVVHHRRPADYRAGRVYLWMAILAEGALVGALLLLVLEAGNLPLEAAPAWVAQHRLAAWVATLMLIGFGVKMGLVGLHMWLPLAHPQAPVPASAVLSGVILKAGLMGWLRFLPVGEDGFVWLGAMLIGLGFATAIFGALIGLTQHRIKSLLAYSSVSQMGFLAMIVALALLEPARMGVLGLSVLFALHHGLAKATLFLGVDLIRTNARLARRLLWIPAAALAGLPPTSGLLVKAALKSTLPDEAAWMSLPVAAASAATTLLMMRLLGLIRAEAGGTERRWPMPWIASLAAALFVPWSWAALVTPELLTASLGLAYVLEVVWPIGVGVAAGVLLDRAFARRGWPHLPPGDVINLRLPWRPRFPAWRPRRWRWSRSVVPGIVEADLQRLAAATAVAVLIAAAVLWL
jgi:formate hydrogenlyase subunit 3/multisubunit Na+/H+ antiporter MnhD subunit